VVSEVFCPDRHFKVNIHFFRLKPPIREILNELLAQGNGDMEV
jgi:hypothetical protein